MVSMTFEQAKEHPIPFGEYKGQTIDKVAETDKGLLYIDWMRGLSLYGDFRIAVSVYLRDPTIRKELGEIMEDR